MGLLDGRVAIVTGSARNIGRATLRMLAGHGAAVVVHARKDAEGVEETRGMLERDGVRVASCLSDVSTEAGARTLIETAVNAFGRLDILVNNAAIRRNTPIADITLEEWREVLGSSLDCAFLCTRSAVPHMRANHWGRIVNVAGISMFRGTAGRAHVSAAKSGMIGMARSLASELGPDGITVNCVAPGVIDTTRGAAAGQRPKESGPGIPVGRDGRPEEVAHAITMLCLPDAAYTTGVTIQVNGGSYYG